MSRCFNSSVNLSLVSLGLVTSAIALRIAAPAWAQTFPDTQNHWAQPFIEALAERDIITGYPDGTFRPNQTVSRDEFAAVIRQAFDQEQVRQIPSGSLYKDVPEGYWAANAIEEAYEMGFMSGYPGGFFRPNQPVSRVESLVYLMSVLDPPTTRPAVATEPATPAPATSPQPARRRLFVPLAFVALMQPLVTPRPAQTAIPPATAAATPPSFTIANYYADAERVPQYAVDAIGKATKANIVVNYPNPKLLNPNQPATRGDIAAFIHQTLVTQGRIEPLPVKTEAANYIVRPTPENNQNAQTGS